MRHRFTLEARTERESEDGRSRAEDRADELLQASILHPRFGYTPAMPPPPFVRSVVREMAGYAPGEQPGAGERVVKLNTNENPFPPSPKVVQAIRELEPEMLRRYPDPMARSFCEAAAKLHEVTPDMI